MATFKTPTLDGSGKVRDKHLPDRLGATALNATFLTLAQAAKNPDLLITGNVTRVDGKVTAAEVVWPDGSPGTFTPTYDSGGAVASYTITYGSPVTKTFTQPTITRDASGAATTIPQIVVS